ncbi:MAG: hypothetical protein RPT95_14920, partial [Candidatus Sedimenticola sp. (ex Thyasira tokunagai)]
FPVTGRRVRMPTLLPLWRATRTTGKQCGLTATGDYQPSLRSPWLAASDMFINKYRRKLNKIFGGTIIQYSPPRSGSTLVYNILRDLFPGKYIKKRHSYESNDSKFPMVVTYRHPLDCIASSIQRYELIPTDEVINQQISEFEENGIWDILEIKDNPSVLMLRYEEFARDFNVIFNELEIFFGIKISHQKRRSLSGRYNINNVEKIIASMDSFSEYDKITHWHGKHISAYKGSSYYYKEFFTDSQIRYLEYVYNKFFQEFNYI